MRSGRVGIGMCPYYLMTKGDAYLFHHFSSSSSSVASMHKSRAEGDMDMLSPQPAIITSEFLEVIPEQPDQVPELSGPLLRRDDKLRWHRSYCRITPAEKVMSVYESPEETQCLSVLHLEGATVVFNPEACDREHCFAIKQAIAAPAQDSLQLMPTGSSKRCSSVEMDHFFAAYSDMEYKQWKSTLKCLMRMVPGSSDFGNVASMSSMDSSARDSVFSSGSGNLEERETVTGEVDRNGHLSLPPPPGMVILLQVHIVLCVC